MLLNNTDDDNEPCYLIDAPVIMAYMTVVTDRRYLLSRNTMLKTPCRIDYVLYHMDEDNFWQQLRMEIEPFFQLYDIIKDHWIFGNDDSSRPQIDINVQMMVALEPTGFLWKGVSVCKISTNLGVSGTFNTYYIVHQ